MAPSSSTTYKPNVRSTTFEMDHDDDKELGQIQLLFLTCTLGGLQVLWSVLNGNINVFLLSIGIPNSISPLIWVIAPICGAFVQPVVGWFSDQSTSRFGRRKPYIFFGAIGTVINLIGLSWTHNIAQGLSGGHNMTVVTGAIAVVWTILLNVSVQPLQMGIRAFVIDGCPKSQQAQANAWAGSALSIGNVFGYLVAFATATIEVHTWGFGHFQYLALIASAALLVTVILSLWITTEKKVLQPQSKSSISSIFRNFRRSTLISSRTRIITRVQFCAWMGWFPFLFYMVSFVSNKDKRPDGPTGMAAQQPMQLKSGALAAFLYALVSCVASILIPYLLRRTKYANAEIRASSDTPTSTLFGISLEKTWCISQIIFAILMFSTIFAFNTTSAIVIIALGGIPWALSNYIPYALIGVEVAEQRPYTSQPSTPPVLENDEAPYSDEVEPEQEAGNAREGEDHENNETAAQVNENSLGTEEAVALGTGATVGLHNAAISSPQIVAALISAAALAVCDKAGSIDPVGWVLRLAGVGALVAAWQVRHLFR